MTGALAAGRHKMDLFGVMFIALVTAIGGGSIRDVLLGHYPLTWVKHPEYIILIYSYLSAKYAKNNKPYSIKSEK